MLNDLTRPSIGVIGAMRSGRGQSFAPHPSSATWPLTAALALPRNTEYSCTAVLRWHDCCWVKATRRSPMDLMSRVAVLAISAVPMYAQAQQSGVVKLKADAQNIVKIISGDKLKTQTYCEIVELDDEIDEEQDSSKAEELSQKVDKLVE